MLYAIKTHGNVYVRDTNDTGGDHRKAIAQLCATVELHHGKRRLLGVEQEDGWKAEVGRTTQDMLDLMAEDGFTILAA